MLENRLVPPRRGLKSGAMSETVCAESSPSPPTPTPPTPTLLELFAAFALISLCGFGGVLAWSRRMLVEQRGWMTPEEFNDAYALCQFLPGPNIVNMSVVFGRRIHGAFGSAVALAGLIGPPFVVVSLRPSSMRASARSQRCSECCSAWRRLPSAWSWAPAPRWRFRCCGIGSALPR
jgi:hypothetical protein